MRDNLLKYDKCAFRKNASRKIFSNTQQKNKRKFENFHKTVGKKIKFNLKFSL